MEALGRIVRLQVQLSSLKVGERPLRRYDPAPLRAVPALLLTEGGVLGLADGGEELLDVHHRDHPASKHRGDNGVSVGFTGHYATMRDRFGPHLADGLAGENILIETPYTYVEADLVGDLLIETASCATVRLERVVVAEPCVEFSRYALRQPPDARTDRAVADALTFLREGMRGFYAAYRGAPARIALGDRVYVA